MVKKSLVLLLALVFIPGISKLSFAAEQTNATAAVQKAEEVGNKICPVTGEKIDEKTKATYEYKGKIYNFCCSMCIDEFKKDPEKYIKKVEQELQAETKPATEEQHKSSHGISEGRS
jgi:YHS domain-containing protein